MQLKTKTKAIVDLTRGYFIRQGLHARRHHIASFGVLRAGRCSGCRRIRAAPASVVVRLTGAGDLVEGPHAELSLAASLAWRNLADGCYLPLVLAFLRPRS